MRAASLAKSNLEKPVLFITSFREKEGWAGAGLRGPHGKSEGAARKV